jgi:hypothetical protein
MFRKAGFYTDSDKFGIRNPTLLYSHLEFQVVKKTELCTVRWKLICECGGKVLLSLIFL